MTERYVQLNVAVYSQSVDLCQANIHNVDAVIVKTHATLYYITLRENS